jgi:hypothetical protein
MQRANAFSKKLVKSLIHPFINFIFIFYNKMKDKTFYTLKPKGDT